MSERWPGGIVRATPVTPTGPLQNGTAPGVWTLDQANYWIKQGLWPTAGNFLAVEDVFSTWLYTGTGSAQTITNGIDLAGNGGMVWIKSRSAATDNFLFDTSRGVNVEINSNTTDANATLANSLTAFNSNGFSISSATGIGVNAATYASWTFREAANFFDVVTYTGDNVSGRAIPHNLGVAPGCMFIKPTNAAGSWIVYHRSTGATKYLVLESTNQEASSATIWGGANPTATQFTIGGSGAVNQTGTTYVAYLFAHDTSSTGLIQCGSVTATTGQATVTLGWEPQWVLVKQSNTAGQNWIVNDVMRNMSVTSATDLQPSSSSAEQSPGQSIAPTATGFTLNASYFGAGTYIYIAIRRGPMRTPTLGTNVFAPVTYSGNSVAKTVTSGFPVDWFISGILPGSAANATEIDRLRGGSQQLITSSTGSEGSYSGPSFASMTGVSLTNGYINDLGNRVAWMFRRAPSFFDEVCYTGTGANLTVNHNLGVAPELVIFKSRTSGTRNWAVASDITSSGYKREYLNLTNPAASYDYVTPVIFTSQPTATILPLATTSYINTAGENFVAYLFASCPGVSKVGSYTGTGALQTINCGFTTGARFVLIKRTDSTGDWYVWDSANGISSGNDPYLLLNSSAAQVTGTNYVDTDTTGFKVTAAAPAGINASGGTYIFLAVA